MKRILVISIILLSFFSSNAQTSGWDTSPDSINYFTETGEYNKGLEYLNRIKPMIPPDDDSVRIIWLIYYGWMNSLLVKADSSYEAFNKAIEIAVEKNYPNLEIKAKGSLLEIFRKMQMYTPAFKLIQNELPYLDKYTTSSQSYFYHRAAAIYNEACYKFEDTTLLDTAIILSNKSLERSIKAGLVDYQATSYNELGNIYERLGDFENASFYYKKSMQLWPNPESVDYANSIKNYGGFLARIGKHDSAIYYFKKVLSLFGGSVESQLLADTYKGLKDSYGAKGDSLNYFKYGQSEIATASMFDRKKLENKIFELNQAKEVAQKDALIRESKIEIEAAKGQKNLVIFILVLLAIILVVVSLTYLLSRRKNMQLAKLVKENEFLVGESNHRIKNNLQLIISLIGREIYKSEENQSGLREISDKITSIATLHQHLYQSDAKEKIQVKDYLISLIENFKNLNYFDQIHVNIAIDPIDLQIERSVYVGLLITELFTNSVKHAFKNKKENREINLKIEKDSTFFTLDYSDNGEGFGDKKAKPQLVLLLSRQLKAEQLKIEKETQGYQTKLKIKL